MKNTAIRAISENTPPKDKSNDIIKKNKSKELFFAVVGPVGAGSSRVIDALERVCIAAEYECKIIKASQAIKDWAKAASKNVQESSKKH